jgi:prepilin-type N-terminal cleavage/methylation domain-containing protein
MVDEGGVQTGTASSACARRGSGRAKVGFSLVELLVVMAIITILAALMLPGLAASRASTRSIVCLSNERQLGLAVRMYVSDDADKFPGASMYEPLTGYKPLKMWLGYDNGNLSALSNGYYGNVSLPAKNPPRPGAVDPYLGGERVKQCPSAPKTWQTGYAANAFCGEYFSSPWGAGEFAPMSKHISPGLRANRCMRGLTTAKWSSHPTPS